VAAALPRLAGENLAAVVRAHLAAARRRGEDFGPAWRAAMTNLPLETPHRRATGQRRDAESWREALQWARPAFHRAFNREPAEGAEGAASALEDLAA
jgi:hypothetical protein